MAHIWVRAEQRPNESRAALTPEGAATLIGAGHRLTVEQSANRVIPDGEYAEAGCAIAPEGSWPEAPGDAIILGLKELPSGPETLRHRHVMFGHAFKGQPAGRALLRRFTAGGGALYDLEYLVNEKGGRLAAFGYWAGYAGAAVALRAWNAQRRGKTAAPLSAYGSAEDLAGELRADMASVPPAELPRVLIIGALGRVGRGAAALCRALDLNVTAWDMAETAEGGPFPQVLEHEVFLNCILAQPGAPVFVPADAVTAQRRLRVIGDIACDPDSDFSPIKVYDRATDWRSPARRLHDDPPLDVTAIDNLPSLLPLDSTRDFAAQLQPLLLDLDRIDAGAWARARAVFDWHIAASNSGDDEAERIVS